MSAADDPQFTQGAGWERVFHLNYKGAIDGECRPCERKRSNPVNGHFFTAAVPAHFFLQHQLGCFAFARNDGKGLNPAFAMFACWQIEPLGDTLTYIREALTAAERLRGEAGAEAENRDMFAGMIGALPCRVIAVIGGEDDKVA